MRREMSKAERDYTRLLCLAPSDPELFYLEDGGRHILLPAMYWTELHNIPGDSIFWKCTGFSIRCKVYKWLFIMDSQEQNPTSGQ
jgi:hypothetical protein